MWGLNYFVIPYGALILALPFIVMRGSAVVRLRPLLFGFWLAFLVGIGGTTPVGHLLLGRAYEVLTMERFSYWATLLALPFVGLAGHGAGRSLSHAGSHRSDSWRRASPVAWAQPGSSTSPAEAEDFKVDSCCRLAQSRRPRPVPVRHSGLRHQNLAAGHATDAGSVDGAWNSGRTLPELTAARRRGAYQFQVLREDRSRRTARHPRSCRPLRIEMGASEGSIL